MLRIAAPVDSGVCHERGGRSLCDAVAKMRVGPSASSFRRDVKPPTAAALKRRGGERVGKAQGSLRWVSIEKMNVSELPMTCRNALDATETGGAQNRRDEVRGKSDYRADGSRHIGSMISIQA